MTATLPWSFHSPTRIHFGVGCRAILPGLLDGQRLLIVSTGRGRQQFEADALLGSIDARVDWVDNVNPNPGLAETQAEIDRLSGQDFDAVLAFGGGSAMDAAKVLAAALSPGLETRDLAALIANPAKYLSGAVLPIHAVTTTSGTGSEVTPFATIWDHANRKKLSLASPQMFPATAVVDPELTYEVPRGPTLSTALDAMNQAFESVWNRNRTPITMLFAGRSIGLALRALPRLVDDLGDQEARVMISEAAVLAGLCISQTRTAICHSISYPLTAHFGISHGFACAYSMAAVARRVLAEAPAGLDEIARLSDHDGSEALVATLEAVLERVDVSGNLAPDLGSKAEILALRGEMFTPGRSDNFILPVSDALLTEIIEAS